MCDATGEEEKLEGLEAEAARLANAIAHLERSQVELAEALAEDPGEAEYTAALAENAETLKELAAKRQALLDAVAEARARAPKPPPEQGAWL